MVVSHALQLLITGKALAGPALKKTGDQVADLARTTEKADGGFTKLFSNLRDAGKNAFKVVATGALAAATGVLALVSAFLGLPAAVGAATAKVTDYAAELDLMRDAMWAITGDAMPAMVAALKESTAFMTAEKDILREYHMAYMLLGQDLATRVPEAMQYLTKVSALTGDTVEYLTSRLVRSVGRLSTRWMAYIGTVVTVEEAEARAAEMFGVLTDELTYQQKQAGMLDGVLQKLAARTSILPDVMGTTKQMSEALKASWKDLWAEVTTHLLPVASALYKILLKSVAVWKALVTQGGALYGPIRKVTATFTVLLEILGELLDKALEVEEGATGALERFADNVISMAWKAVQWGSNIAVNLAAGIVRGASTALIGAMNFISNLLAHWLAPGSAPLVVSNILDWGASAFTEFLRGFSMADFDIIEGVQGPLKRALKVLVDLEELGFKEAGEYFIGLSEMMAEAIATGDPGAVFAKLAEIPGGFGESLAELYRRQLDLGAAVERLAKAEMRLAAARKAEEASGVKLSKQAREYNKLAQAGADPAILAAKLAEVKASYASLIAAREETDAAEEEVDAEKELVKWQKEQVRLQERLLNQLIEMSQAFADLLPDRDGAGDDDPFVIPPIEWPEGFLVPIDTAFDELKDSIRAKFAALWADLRKQWEESGAGLAVADLKARWDEFYTDTLVPIGDELGKLWGTFKGWVTDDAWPWVLSQWDAWSTWWAENGPGIIKWLLGIGDAPYSYKNLWAWVVEEWDKWVAWWEEDGPTITKAIDAVGAAVGDLLASLWGSVTGEELSWQGIWDKAEEIFGFFVDSIQILAELGMAQLRGYITVGAQLILGDWEGALETMQEMGETSWSAINKLTRGKLEELTDTIYNAWMQIAKDADWHWNTFILGIRVYVQRLEAWLKVDFGAIAEAWHGIWGDLHHIMYSAIMSIYNTIVGTLNNLKERWITGWNELKLQAGAALIAISAVVLLWAPDLYAKIIQPIMDAIQWVRDRRDSYKDTGKGIIQGLIDGIGSMAGLLLAAVTVLAQEVMQRIKDALGMHSRSKVFFEFGQNVADSFASGIEDLTNKPAMAVTHMADFTGVTAQSAVGTSPEGYAATGITIHNHFGKDSVRSTQDILLIADQIQRSMELKGVRERIA